NPQPEFFFTPMIEDQTIAEEGVDAYYSRYHKAETRFLRQMSSWLAIRHGQGPSDLVDAFQSLPTAEQAPNVSRILMPYPTSHHLPEIAAMAFSFRSLPVTTLADSERRPSACLHIDERTCPWGRAFTATWERSL